MKNLIWKIFPPYEVKVTREAIDELLNKFPNNSSNVIVKEAKKLVNNAEKTVYSIRIEHINPEYLAFIIITNVIARDISSGSYHTYRGVLNLIGMDMKSLWLKLQDYMVAKGYINSEQQEKDNAWLYQQIKMMG
ncbi:hypothetical protein [Celerinatantimonas sp. MCCC 1A17872]|uniref:hypothetical protein n=1 Tax=Celerinatantimonas sp. MCCC 1A17872 TaxID=3177514 RepID=UPI0038C7B268